MNPPPATSTSTSAAPVADHELSGADLPSTVEDPTALAEPTLRLRRRRSAGARNERRHGTVGAALSHQAFRRVAAGAFASNIGTWMQNVTLIALANQLTHSGAFVGLVSFPAGADAARLAGRRGAGRSL